MKLVIAIVNRKDASNVSKTLSEHQYMFTELATKGGFLKKSNTTMLIGINDNQVEDVLDLIHQNCAQRKEIIPAMLYENPTWSNLASTEIVVGGATVFIIDVNYFEKM